MADLVALASALASARDNVRAVLRPPFEDARDEAVKARAAVVALATAGRIDTAERSASRAAEAEGIRGELRAALAEALPLAEHAAAPRGQARLRWRRPCARRGIRGAPPTPLCRMRGGPCFPGGRRQRPGRRRPCVGLRPRPPCAA
jgi:hypothetical protein